VRLFESNLKRKAVKRLQALDLSVVIKGTAFLCRGKHFVKADQIALEYV